MCICWSRWQILKETAFVLFWYLLLGCPLPSPSVFQINHLSFTFSSFLCSLSSPLSHVRNVIMFGDQRGEKQGIRVVEGFGKNVGKRKKNAFVCVPNYYSSQPKVTFEESRHTSSENSYLYPASSLRVGYSGDEVGWIMRWSSSSSSERFNMYVVNPLCNCSWAGRAFVLPLIALADWILVMQIPA